MNIVGIKLASGEELIAQRPFGKNGNTFEKIRVFGVFNQQGSLQVTLSPYIWMNPDVEIEFKDAQIVDTFPVPKQVEDQYIQQTSGIALAH